MHFSLSRSASGEEKDADEAEKGQEDEGDESEEEGGGNTTVLAAAAASPPPAAKAPAKPVNPEVEAMRRAMLEENSRVGNTKPRRDLPKTPEQPSQPQRWEVHPLPPHYCTLSLSHTHTHTHTHQCTEG